MSVQCSSADETPEVGRTAGRSLSTVLGKSGSEEDRDGTFVCGAQRLCTRWAEGTRSCSIQKERENIQHVLRRSENRSKASAANRRLPINL